MPRVAKVPKAVIADRLTPVFETYGYDGASLTMLAEVSGLSKASLYHHFPRGKEDMAARVLGRAGVCMQQHILGPLQSSAPARERLQASFEGVAIYYSGAAPVCLMNSLLLGSGHGLFGKQISRAVAAWQTALAAAYHATGLADETADKQAQKAIEQIQGALVLCRVQQSRMSLDECLKALKRLL